MKIGDFSRLTGITVKTLRYYDELGILKPAGVDSFTGYRSYSADQVPRLYRIIALKDMGLSLEEIARLLQDDVSITHILDILHIKQEALKKRLEDESEHLKWLEAWIRETENGNELPAYQVTLKKVLPQPVVTVRTMIPNTFDPKPVAAKILPAVSGLFNHILNSNARVVGPAIGMFHGETYETPEFDWELALPVSQEVPSTDEYQYKELAGYDQVVSLIHQGGVNSGAPANRALVRWFEANPYRIIGPRREVYLIDFTVTGADRRIVFTETENGSPPGTFVVEIQIPVEKI